MSYLLMLALLGVCFALGWQARDMKQDRVDAAEFWERHERPCEHVDSRYGACTSKGEHFMHTRGSLSWTGSWPS